MIRGWCPSLHEPMATGDGMLVRVKPRGGVMTASHARLIAEQAERFGNGALELTGRANLQVRGLSPDGVAPFARAMVAAGLAHADRAAERRRNVISTPLADIDPAASQATSAITVALETALEADEALAALPAKFGFLVDGGGVLPVIARSAAMPQSRTDRAAPGSPRRDAARDDGVRADIVLYLLANRAEIVGAAEVVQVPLNAAVSTALALAHDFSRSLRQAAAPSPGGRRFVSPVGAVGSIAFGAGLPFGATTARVWSALADLAERHGDGKLRLTPWRAVLIAGGTSRLRAPLADLGLITDPDDARLRVAACPGQPACASASVSTRTFAARLRPAIGTTIHVSGCDKGCAHPAAASITLVGREGRFDLVRKGRAGDPPVQRGLSPAEVLAL